MKFTAEVPYRRYRYTRGSIYGSLVITGRYKKLMKIIGKALKNNKQVIFTHEIIDNDRVYNGTWYDKVTVTIND